jgi:predicted O-methyltransferase YrrM
VLKGLNMNISISHKIMSSVTWGRILENSSFILSYEKENFYRQLDELENLRVNAAYNTGSISASTAWLLFSTSYYFKSKKVIEIGTFIGKSTIAIAMGMHKEFDDCEIHTCDASNDIKLPNVKNVKITQYPKLGSSEMLQSLEANASNNGIFDLIHIDGRLMPNDYKPLKKILSDKAIIVIDDFEGVEKGVINAINLKNNGFEEDYFLVYPPEEKLLKKYGLSSSSTTGLLLPKKIITLSAQ